MCKNYKNIDVIECLTTFNVGLEIPAIFKLINLDVLLLRQNVHQRWM